MRDTDPSISIALAKNGRRRTFDIGRRQDGSWAVLETGDSPRIVVLGTHDEALRARAAIDQQLRELLEDGWTPA